MFYCTECNVAKTSKQYLLEHIEVVHEGIIYRCPYESCPSTFTSKTNIRSHIQLVHKNERFSCSNCDYVANTRRQVVVHEGRVHKEKTFQCKLCEFRGGYQHVINRHMKKFHEAKLSSLDRFQCYLCNVMYRRKDNIKPHFLQFHAGSFYDHTKIKKTTIKNQAKVVGVNRGHFECYVCGMIFWYKWNLKNHFNRKHETVFDPEKVRTFKDESVFNDQRTVKEASGANHKLGVVGEQKAQAEDDPGEVTQVEDEKSHQGCEYMEEEDEEIFIKEEDMDEFIKEGTKEEEDNISDDEEENVEIKLETTETYLCPLTFCTFSTQGNDAFKIKSHLMLKHPNIDHKSVKFIKL